MQLIMTSLNTVGTLLIAWAALSVHHRVLNDHKISKDVYIRMKIEQSLGVFGMILIIVSYLLNFVTG